MANELPGGSSVPSNSASNVAIDETYSMESELARQLMQEKSDIVNLLSLMAYNQTYVQLLDQLVVKVDSALMKNRNAQSAIKNKLNSKAGGEFGLSRRQLGVTLSCWPPYFKDSNGMMPVQNRESMEINRICAVDPLIQEDNRWKDREVVQLTDEIAQSLKEQQIMGLDARKEIVAAKVRLAGVETTEEQVQSWRDEVTRINRRTNFIRERSTEDELREANGDFSCVDWAKISARVFQGSRSITELVQKWCNDLVFPQSEWTFDEDERLMDLANDCTNWDTVAQLLGSGRSAFRCFERRIYLQQAQRLPKAWTPEEDQELRRYIRLLKVGDEIPWAKISMYMEGRNKNACEYRYVRSLNEKLRHGRWTHGEDLLLLNAVNKYGPQNWNKIAEAVQGRSALQARDRWIHVLDFKRRDLPWGWEEHQRLMYGVRLFGREHCAKIAKLIPGRNNMDVRMRMRLLLKYKIEEERKPKRKRVFRHYANNYIFCKMRRNKVIEEFKKYLEAEQKDKKSQLAARLGFGEYVAAPEHGLGLDYTNVKKERSQEFGQWKISGSGRWMRVIQKNPNEYNREDLMDELNRLPEEVRDEALEWIRESDERLELERVQENDIPDDPVEAKEFYEQIYPKERLEELSALIGELLAPRQSDYNYYERYKKRPPKIRLKKDVEAMRARKKLLEMKKRMKKKGKKQWKKPRVPKMLTTKIEEIDLEGLKWSDRIMLEINKYLSDLPKSERREYLVRSVCNAVRLRVHHLNLARMRTEFKEKAFRLMVDYVKQVVEDPPAPIPIMPVSLEERENSVVLPPHWAQLSLRDMIQFRIAPHLLPALVRQAKQTDLKLENEEDTTELAFKSRVRKRRRPIEKTMAERFKDTVFYPLTEIEKSRLEKQRAANLQYSATQQKIMAKMLPPCPGTVKAVEYFNYKARRQCSRAVLIPAPLNFNSSAEGQSSSSEAQPLYQKRVVPDEERQNPRHELLKKRIFRLFFLPMAMHRAVRIYALNDSVTAELE